MRSLSVPCRACGKIVTVDSAHDARPCPKCGDNIQIKPIEKQTTKPTGPKRAKPTGPKRAKG